MQTFSRFALSRDLQQLECRPYLSGRHLRELGAQPPAPDLLGAAAARPMLVAAPISNSDLQHNNACVALSVSPPNSRRGR